MLKESAFNIAQSTLSANPALRLMPVPGSMLSTAVSTVRPSVQVNEMSEYVAAACATTVNIVDGEGGSDSMHTQFVTSFVERVAPMLRAHIAYARGTGKAMVEECYETLAARFAQQTARPASESFTVVPVDLPVVLDQGVVQDLMGTPEPLKNEFAVVPLGMPALSRTTLVEMLCRGGKTFDSAVSEWVVSINDDVLLQAWRSYFIGGSSGSIVGEPYMYQGHAQHRLTVALLVALWASKLEIQLPEDYRGLSAVEVEAQLGRIKRQAVDVIRRTADQLRIMTNRGNFVLETNVMASTMYVLAPTYQDWLSKGGDVTVLLGMMASGRVLTDTVTIDMSAKEFLNSWRLYEAMNIRNFENSRLELFRVIACDWFDASLRDLSVEERDYSQTNPGWLESVRQRGRQYLQTRTLAELTDLATVAMELVGNIRLGFTATYPLLKGIHDARQANPKLDVREAALLSAIQYVSDYMADQVAVV